jgi:radical SAM/Cys-rich protein
MKSLKARDNKLAESAGQIEVLTNGTDGHWHQVPAFEKQLEKINRLPLTPVATSILQINLGKMCNQVCRHCHVDAGPDRKEIMPLKVMQYCIAALKSNPALTTVDLTGGAPEMNPDFRWFVEQVSALGRHIIVRCNLTIIVANKKYNDLPDFFKTHKVEVVSSLPFYTRDRTDSQRGSGVFEDSIRALKMLNDVGYGREGSGLILNLVYNPAGAFLPASQQLLQQEFKRSLSKDFGIEFNQLLTITNMPISRYLEYLLESGNYEKYMQKLLTAFNPAAVPGLMCRNTLSVSWDGYLYDCDFNQMLELKVDSSFDHISQYKADSLLQRNIVVNQHCYGCTAGAGSGCGGAILE